MNVEEYLNQLNESQRKRWFTMRAILGRGRAGSGKTRVLTYKIAYLLQLDCLPIVSWR